MFHGWHRALDGCLSRKTTTSHVNPVGPPAGPNFESPARAERVLDRVIRVMCEEKLGSQWGALRVLKTAHTRNSTAIWGWAAWKARRNCWRGLGKNWRSGRAFAGPCRFRRPTRLGNLGARAILGSTGGRIAGGKGGSRSAVAGFRKPCRKTARAATVREFSPPETLVDVLRYGAAHDAERSHLLDSLAGTADAVGGKRKRPLDVCRSCQQPGKNRCRRRWSWRGGGGVARRWGRVSALMLRTSGGPSSSPRWHFCREAITVPI